MDAREVCILITGAHKRYKKKNDGKISAAIDI